MTPFTTPTSSIRCSRCKTACHSPSVRGVKGGVKGGLLPRPVRSANAAYPRRDGTTIIINAAFKPPWLPVHGRRPSPSPPPFPSSLPSPMAEDDNALQLLSDAVRQQIGSDGSAAAANGLNGYYSQPSSSDTSAGTMIIVPCGRLPLRLLILPWCLVLGQIGGRRSRSACPWHAITAAPARWRVMANVRCGAAVASGVIFYSFPHHPSCLRAAVCALCARQQAVRVHARPQARADQGEGAPLSNVRGRGHAVR